MVSNTHFAFGSVQVEINYQAIDGLFEQARTQGRDTLFEYEVYDLLKASGAETPPRCVLLERAGRPQDERLCVLPGDKVVLKIVSPAIIHKTEVGGVRVVENSPDAIRSAWRRMLQEVPENYTAFLERTPEAAPRPMRG